ncbi:hypothetical protein ALP8811_02708 [Aliiroseovarius pelagivivens]|uniref:Uncharacterized protein n=1 Tax=Aliiroseovarius pelagivivens TaxID=1639690 RepID=A0A2R8ARS6_9RHOB|nr:hypothetical protein ALP8811_02708 [Aliiroseovarius pelagivivens]
MLSLGFELPAVALRTAGSSSSPAPFSPLQLAPSAMFDPANTAQLYQDDAGTTAVTADNQPVGLWQDETLNGLDLSQAVSAARPSYRTDGTYHWIETDGVDDGLVSLPSLRVGNPMTMVLGYQLLTTVGAARVNFAEISKNSANGMSMGSHASYDRLQYYSRLVQEGVNASNLVANSIWGGHQIRVATLQTYAGGATMRLDGVKVMTRSQNLMSEFVDAQPLRVGLAEVSGSIPGAFRLYGLQVWDSTRPQPSLTQIEMLEQWMADKIGVTL